MSQNPYPQQHILYSQLSLSSSESVWTSEHRSRTTYIIRCDYRCLSCLQTGNVLWGVCAYGLPIFLFI